MKAAATLPSKAADDIGSCTGWRKDIAVAALRLWPARGGQRRTVGEPSPSDRGVIPVKGSREFQGDDQGDQDRFDETLQPSDCRWPNC
jgi:hypothetical protein